MQPGPTPQLEAEVARLFRRGGVVAVEACPLMAACIRSWVRPEVDVTSELVRSLVTSVLWQADRRERRTSTGEEETALARRRSLREGVLGYLFLPRQDESRGVPRTEADLLAVTDGRPFDPGLQKQRQRYAALRQVKFEHGGDVCRPYRPGSLEVRARNEGSAYAERLLDDLTDVLGNRDELILVLAEFIRLDQMRDEWQTAYRHSFEGSALARYGDAGSHRGNTPAAGEFDHEVHYDASIFLGDISLPDGTVVPRGTTVIKTWRIQNAGTVPWVGRRLRRMTPHSNTFPTSPAEVEIADTQPEEAVDISVALTTSHVEGSTEIRFKMIDAEGNICFPDRYSYGLVVVLTTIGRP